MKRPAIRIVFAPLQRYRDKKQKELGHTIYGMQQGRTIYIDPRTSNPASTFMHERFHMDHPDWSEDQVVAAEEKWWKKAGWKEKAEVLQLLAHAEIINPKEVL